MPAPPNKPSRVLSADENSLTFSLLGPKCVTIATTPAKMFFGTNNGWTFQSFGVLCLVRDANKRSHFLRFYCLKQLLMLFEHKVHSGMPFMVLDKSFFRFDFDGRVVGFGVLESPAGLQEAGELAEALRAKMEKLTKGAAARAKVHDMADAVKAKLGKAGKGADKGAVKGAVKGADKHGGGKKGKITAKDIGMPTDARHMQHLGSDGNGGIQSMDYASDPAVQQLFSQMGPEYEEMLRQKKCDKMLEDFIKSKGGIEKFKELVEQNVGTTTHGGQAQSAPATSTPKKPAPSRPLVPTPMPPPLTSPTFMLSPVASPTPGPQVTSAQTQPAQANSQTPPALAKSPPAEMPRSPPSPPPNAPRLNVNQLMDQKRLATQQQPATPTPPAVPPRPPTPSPKQATTPQTPVPAHPPSNSPTPPPPSLSTLPSSLPPTPQYTVLKEPSPVSPVALATPAPAHPPSNSPTPPPPSLSTLPSSLPPTPQHTVLNQLSPSPPPPPTPQPPQSQTRHESLPTPPPPPPPVVGAKAIADGKLSSLPKDKNVMEELVSFRKENLKPVPERPAQQQSATSTGNPLMDELQKRIGKFRQPDEDSDSKSDSKEKSSDGETEDDEWD